MTTSYTSNDSPRASTRHHADVLARREPLEVGHAVLDDERASGGEVPGRVLKARDLFVLRDQVEDRVEDEVDERELSVDGRRREVADGRRRARRPPGLSRSLATIASEASIPSTRTPRSASGSAIRPVPIANSSARPPAARLREQVDGRRHDRRGEHVGRVLVVDSAPRARRRTARRSAQPCAEPYSMSPGGRRAVGWTP